MTTYLDNLLRRTVPPTRCRCGQMAFSSDVCYDCEDKLEEQYRRDHPDEYDEYGDWVDPLSS